ncbi:MAG: STAS domain-containing protein [Rhodospirillaceae bacterium]
MRIFRFHGVLDHSNVLDRLSGVARVLERDPWLGTDMGRVTAIDTAGLAGLVRLLAEAKKLGGEVWLTDASDPVRRALALTRLDCLFPIAGDATR